MNPNPKYLKTRSGDVIGWTQIQAAKPGNYPCDVTGKLMEIDGVTESINMAAAKDRRVAKFLGNPETQQLLPYTEILAERANLVSVDSPEEWQYFLDNQVPAQETAKLNMLDENVPISPAAETPSLSRHTETPVGAVSVTPKAELDDVQGEVSPALRPKSVRDVLQAQAEPSEAGTTITPVPSIADLDAAAAKTVIAEWTLANNLPPIDRRKGLNTLLGECERQYDRLTKRATAAA